MKKYLSLLIIISLILSLFNSVKAADVDLIVSPIKYEIQANPGATITKSAKLINKTTNTLVIHTWKSDFISNDSSWNPSFVRKSELVNPDQELASWITIDTSSFNIAAQEEKDIEFTIHVPVDATPGWHYGAVFFKNNGADNASTWWQIKINVDYWVLLLVNVDWEVIDDGEPWEPIITNTTNGWWYSWTEYLKDNPKIDKCPLWDLTSSNIDWKCIDDFWLWNIIDDIIWNNTWTWTWTINENETVEDTNNQDLSNENVDDEIVGGVNDENNEEDELNSAEEEFSIEFWVPFKNDWNTHIKPTWKITLLDENGNEIKWVWKELIKNDQWTIIWEKIVDYIPINDNWGNVLPDTERIFVSEWKWFPYEAYDEKWAKIIKYWTPSEYYSKKNIEEKTMIFPWERINEKLEQKKVSAIIEIAYKNYKWEDIEFNSAKDFYVDYTTKSVWLNPYFFISLIFSLWILWFLFFILRRKNRIKCEKCKKCIKKDMKICPYCGTKQKEKKK